jgi:N-acetylmuramoyl-L-alanine amidase
VKGTRLRHDVVPSPNFESRLGGVKPDILLLHYTGMESAAIACRRLCDAASKVSCHYLVDVDGSVTQMVDEDMRAWHAGASSWRAVTDINSRSIGIEIQNIGHNGDYPDFSDGQMTVVIDLCTDILSRHDIGPENVIGHSDVAPGRKTDPGEKFDWQQFWRAGIGHWVEPAKIGGSNALPQDVAALQGQLARYGYGIDVNGTYDERTRIVVEAFQRHFRPAQVDGVADVSTRETLERLIAALPQQTDGTV